MKIKLKTLERITNDPNIVMGIDDKSYYYKDLSVYICCIVPKMFKYFNGNYIKVTSLERPRHHQHSVCYIEESFSRWTIEQWMIEGEDWSLYAN